MLTQRGVLLQPIRMGGFRSNFQPFRMGQLIDIKPTFNPSIQVKVETGIERYLLPIGLLASGVAAFVLGTALPTKWRPATTISGLGLVGAGVGVFLYRGLKKADGAAPAPGGPAPVLPPPPSGGQAVTTESSGPQAFQPPTLDGFNSIQFQVVSPASGQTIGSSGGFLFFGSKKIPVQLRMYNPTNESVTFNLDFAWDEAPGFTGYDRGLFRGTQSFQVTLGPNEQKNQTFDLPIRTDVSWTQIQTALSIYKKRTPLENSQMIANLSFTVT